MNNFKGAYGVIFQFFWRDVNVFVQICFFMVLCFVSFSACLLGELKV